MRNPLILLTLLLLVLSCSIKKKPEFLGVGNIKVVETSSRHITLGAEAHFKNPNSVGGKLWTDEIRILINDIEMAKVSSKAFEVPAKNEFKIPLVAKIATDSLISDKSVSGLLSSLLSQRIKVEYTGDIEYKILGLSHKYTIDKSETIKIKF